MSTPAEQARALIDAEAFLPGTANKPAWLTARLAEALDKDYVQQTPEAQASRAITLLRTLAAEHPAEVAGDLGLLAGVQSTLAAICAGDDQNAWPWSEPHDGVDGHGVMYFRARIVAAKKEPA